MVLILKRLKSVLGYATDAELASFLGVNASTVSIWKSRNSINWDLVFQKAPSIDLNWLITGKSINPQNEISSVQNEKKVDLPPGPCQQCALRDQIIKAQEDAIAALKARVSTPEPGQK